MCSRVAKLCQKNKVALSATEQAQARQLQFSHIAKFELSQELSWVMDQVANEDKFLAEQQPWLQPPDQTVSSLKHALQTIVMVAAHLQPFLPETSQKILEHFSQSSITAIEPLFPRLTTS